MDWKSIAFDWNRARAFLVTAEEGSLSAAARALRMSQPTLGRQVAALEKELGVALFERVDNRLTLTRGGLELLDHVRAMGEAASATSLAASGRSQSVEGDVCISAYDSTAVFVMPKILARLRSDLPDITFEVVASAATSDLRRREADIAIRAVEPTDPDLIARKLRPDVIHFYAADGFLAAHGPFDTPESLSEAQFLGLPKNDPFRPGYLSMMRDMGLPVADSNFRLVTSSQLAHWAYVKEGLGIGLANVSLGDAEFGVSRAIPWLPPLEIGLWLVTHRELRTSTRIRLVYDALYQALGPV